MSEQEHNEQEKQQVDNNELDMGSETVGQDSGGSSPDEGESEGIQGQDTTSDDDLASAGPAEPADTRDDDAGSAGPAEPADLRVEEAQGEQGGPPPIPTAVVGYGFAGRDFHSYLVSLEAGLELVAVASRSPERRAAAEADYSVRTYETLDELLARDEAQLVIIATPHHTHEELAVKAMDAGRNVVVDKAMCLTVEEADRMIEASERNRVMLSVFHNRRWDGDYLTLRKTIDAGLLGEVFLIEECVMGYHQPGGWRGVKAESGGPLYDWGAHLVDHAVQIAGAPPDWVFCDTRRDKWSTDVETYVKCLIKFRNGLLYCVEVGYLAKTSKPKFFALGTEGSFVKHGVDPQEAFMRQKRILEAVEDPELRATVKTTVNGLDTEIRPVTVKGDWCAFYRNIAQHLSAGMELAVKPEGAREAIRVIESAMISAKEHRVVKL